MTRGLTMIEVLMALALLAALSAALASWTMISARGGQEAQRYFDWQRNAQGVLRLIREDLLIGDFDVDSSRPRVEASHNRLRIRSRGSQLAGNSGSVTHTFSLSPTDSTLIVTTSGRDDQNSSTLMDSIQSFISSFDEESHVLTIEMRSTTGEVISWRYLLQ